jgi:tetratricopeptide (TPR) repeat protein
MKLCLSILILLFHIGRGFADEESDLKANALNAYKSGSYDVAIDSFNKLIQLNVTDAYLGRGRAYAMKEAYDKAIGDFDELIQRRPSAIAYQYRGDAYLRMGNYEKAANDYSQAIQRDPSNGNLYAYRANAYLLNQQFSIAKIDCRTAIMLLEENPNSIQSLTLAYCIKGQALVSDNNDECFEAFDKAIQLSPKDILPYLSRANTFAVRRKLSRAIDDYNVVIRLDPTNATTYSKIAAMEFAKGNYVKGIEDCNKGIKVDPNCAVVYDRLAWILAVCPDSKLRDGEKALENARKACQLTAWKEPQCFDTPSRSLR